MEVPYQTPNRYLNINMNFNIPNAIASSVTSMPKDTQHPQTAITKLQSLGMSKDDSLDSEYKPNDKSIINNDKDIYKSHIQSSILENSQIEFEKNNN